MKKMQRFSEFTLIALLITSFSLFPFHGSFVRCMEENGHDRIELAVQGACISCEPLRSHRTGSVTMFSVSTSKHCTDIPLESGQIQLNHRKLRLKAPLLTQCGHLNITFRLLNIPIISPVRQIQQSTFQPHIDLLKMIRLLI